MKLKLHDFKSWYKELTVTDEDNDFGLLLKVDYDDVDHETVLRDLKRLIEIVNSHRK